MASALPDALDNFPTNRTGGTPTSGVHADEHNNVNDALNKLERSVQLVFNVKRYNAVGDGVTDDTAAIQAAIDAAAGYVAGSYPNGFKSGVVFFPIGVYLISAALYTEAGIRLVGAQGQTAGRTASVIKASTSGTFTNGAYTEAAMIKASRTKAVYTGTGYWTHGGSLELLKLDCNDAAGLSGYHGWAAGELFLIHRVQVMNAGQTSRTPTDVTLNGSATVVSGTAAFTQDDVSGRVTSGAFPTYTPRTFTDAATTADSTTVTSATANFTGADVGAEFSADNAGFNLTTYVVAVNSATSITVSNPALATQTGKSITLDRPRDFRIQRVVNATTAVLTRPVPVTATNQTVTFYRPRPGIRLEGGGATLLISSLNCSKNSGPGLEIVKGSTNNDITSLTGDNNGGPLLRISQTAAGDIANYNVTFKSECAALGATDYDIFGRQDPAILIDNSGSMHLNLSGVALAGDRGSYHVVRIDQSNTYASGFPAVEIHGSTPENPYNVAFDYLLWDTANVKGVKAHDISVDAIFYPAVFWNKDVRVDGTQGGFWDWTGTKRKLVTTTNYTMTYRDRIVGIQTTNQRTITLPLASSVPVGETYTVKDESGNAGTANHTVSRQGSDALDGVTSKLINTAYGSISVYSNGTNWFTV